MHIDINAGVIFPFLSNSKTSCSSIPSIISLVKYAEHGACAGKKELATLAKELGLDAVHDTVHEMAKDEARHGCGFNGLLKRYFGK